MMGLLNHLQEEDGGAVMICGRAKIQKETDIPAGAEFTKLFKCEEGRDGNTYLKITVETIKRMSEIKWSRSGRLMAWLKAEGVMLEIDRWRTARARTVGFLINVHPTLTWKQDLKEELSAQLEEVKFSGYEKSEWKKKAGKGSASDVPEFQLAYERKGFGIDKGRVYTTVLNVETRIEDSQYMKALMKAATQQQLTRGVFIEAGFHISTSTKRLIAILNGQNRYLHSIRPITVVGIASEIMEKW